MASQSLTLKSGIVSVTIPASHVDQVRQQHGQAGVDQLVAQEKQRLKAVVPYVDGVADDLYRQAAKRCEEQFDVALNEGLAEAFKAGISWERKRAASERRVTRLVRDDHGKLVGSESVVLPNAKSDRK